jgi:hypothetical protein
VADLVTGRRVAAVLVAAAVAVLGWAATPKSSAPPAVAPAAVSAGTAAAALDQLPVKGRAPKTGYSRSQFGKGWSDPDGNGCDARRDVLARQAVGEPVRRGKAQCVFTADIVDPYSGTVIPSTTADVDHVVALGDAWVKGAQQLDSTRREALANDPLNLLAVAASLNRQKSDSDAASWLPPAKSARCGYVARQVAVKMRYGLWVTPAERDAIARVLAGCPGDPLPT